MFTPMLVYQTFEDTSLTDVPPTVISYKTPGAAGNEWSAEGRQGEGVYKESFAEDCLTSAQASPASASVNTNTSSTAQSWAVAARRGGYGYGYSGGKRAVARMRTAAQQALDRFMVDPLTEQVCVSVCTV
jgi:hypothetical protein